MTVSRLAPIERRDCHPTPPLISFAATLPLQGRVALLLLSQLAIIIMLYRKPNPRAMMPRSTSVVPPWIVSLGAVLIANDN